ncbi:MAG: tetratricopeptide repeat protein [Cyclobacteriaceae bacterium]
MARVSLTTYYKTALDLHKSGKLKEARKLYEEILKINENHHDSIAMLGRTYYQEQKFEEAITWFEKGLKRRPDDPNPALNICMSLIKLGRYEEAEKELDLLRKKHPNNASVLFHQARNLKELGHLEEAQTVYEKLAEIHPDHLHGLNNLANLYQLKGNDEKAIHCYDQLIAKDPTFAMAWCNKAGLFQKMNRTDEAENLYKKALAIDSKNSLAIFNLGILAGFKLDFQKALELIKKSVEIEPANIRYQCGLADTLYSAGRKPEAVRLLTSLINSGVSIEDPYLKLAKILLDGDQFKEASQALQLLLKQNPYSAEAHYLLGAMLEFTSGYEKAEEHLLKAGSHPDFQIRSAMTLLLLYSKIVRVDKYHDALEKTKTLLRKYVESESVREEVAVYNLAYYPFEQGLKKEVSKLFSSMLSDRIAPLRKRLSFSYKSGPKLKIGYLSPYFKLHPSAHMIHDTLKYHDRNDFEIVAYGLNRERDEITAKIEQVVDQYVDLSKLNIEQAASKINEDGVNILVSLAGYNHGMKNEIPALRPAPVQVVCMDYHESMQSDFYDYMFKDEVVLTPELRPWHNESIAFLPGCHFLHSELIPSEKEITRKTYGLPESGFVFGCLNHPRKFNPELLRSWFKILNKTPDSVLWLYGMDKSIIHENIHKLAREEGIDPARIIFCGREHYSDHYNRMRLIDLFLDTTIYNGHTTCLEALWQSVPVLTVLGDTVSSRMCASFLSAAGLKQLICEDLNEYEEKAVLYGTDREAITQLSEEMHKARKSAKLFDVRAQVHNLEKAYKTMWAKYQNNEQPSDFHIN